MLGPVPALYLNPFLLAESQRETMRGYIVISHHGQSAKMSYELLFLQGQRVYECIAIDEQRRERADLRDIHKRFADSTQKETMTIALFEAEDALTQAFISTLCTPPIIRVSVDALSKKQIQRLVSLTDGRRAVAERNDFTQNPPLIEFKEVDPTDTHLDFHIGFRHGTFLLYGPGRIEPPDGVAQRVQNSPPQEKAPDTKSDAQGAAELTLFPENAVPPPDPARKPPPGKKKGAEFAPEPIPVPAEDAPATSIAPASPPAGEASELVRLFDRLFRSFRQQASECYGVKSGILIKRAEEQVQMLTPEFASGSLTAVTAPLVLDIVEQVVKDAPIFKRSKLRASALGLISEIYNKQYALLEQHKAIDRVEQVYYRLKK
jgi:hypothetical protein